MYSRNARTPWKGIGPLGADGHSRQLAVNPEARLSEEAGSNDGNVIPVPPTIDKAQLQSDIRNLRIRTDTSPTRNESSFLHFPHSGEV